MMSTMRRIRRRRGSEKATEEGRIHTYTSRILSILGFLDSMCVGLDF